FDTQYVGTGGRPNRAHRIAQGHWPYAAMRGSYRPRRGAPPLQSLPPRVQRLMRDCFEGGHVNPTGRPTADYWHQALAQAEREWNGIRPRLRHFYYRVLNRRAWGQELLRPLSRMAQAAARVPRAAR